MRILSLCGVLRAIVVSGEKPAPGPLMQQVECILQTLHSIEHAHDTPQADLQATKQEKSA